MVDSYLSFGLFYNTAWKYNVMYMSKTNVPVVKVDSDYVMGKKDVYSIYNTAKSKGKLALLGVMTGPYQKGLDVDYYNLVVDIDDLGYISKEEKEGLEKQFAKEGFVVVSTRRGLHLHVKLPRNEEVYAIYIVGTSDEGKMEKKGEGASLQRHLWTSPPSRRVLSSDNKFYIYKFVLPDGTRISKYDPVKLKDYNPPLTSLKDVSEVLDKYLGYSIRKYMPRYVTSPDVLKNVKLGDSEYSRIDPVFLDISDFLLKVHNLPLPPPVAIILKNFYLSEGAVSLASNIVARNPVIRRLPEKITYGSRFLASACFTLFVANLVMFPKFQEIMDILSRGVEDFPNDDGMSMDRKLSYLLLFDESGEYVYPRYYGLGALRPVFYCDKCFYVEECRSRGFSPWRHYRRLFKKIEYSRIVQTRS